MAVAFRSAASLMAYGALRGVALTCAEIEARLTMLKPHSQLVFGVGDRWIDLSTEEARRLRLRAGSGGERAREYAAVGDIKVELVWPLNRPERAAQRRRSRNRTSREELKQREAVRRKAGKAARTPEQIERDRAKQREYGRRKRLRAKRRREAAA